MSITAIQVGGGWFPESAGGLNRYYFDLLNALAATDVTCRGLVVGTPAVDEMTLGRVHAYAREDAPLLARWRAGRSAARAIWRDVPQAADALHVSHFALYAWPMAVPRGRPHVVHFHGPYAAESAREGAGRIASGLKRALEQSVYRRADKLIVLSQAFKRVLCDDYAIEPKRVAVIPGGVEVTRFTAAAAATRAEARAHLGWPTDRPVVLAVRRLVARMGLENLIDAVARVRQTMPDALCLIAGRGRLAEALQGRIAAAGLQDYCRLLGFVSDEDLPWAYRAADVSVVPTESLEGFGLIAIESLAAGTPVLVTPVGGLPEVVSELDNNLVLPDGTAETMANALIHAFKNPASLPASEACRGHAERFAWPTIAARVADEYRAAVAARRA